MKKLNLVGMIFGRLEITAEQPSESANSGSRWIGICACGREVVASRSSLRSGKVKSCGCFRREFTTRKNTTHGLSRKYMPEYVAWKAMKSRCGNKNAGNFSRYGAIGVFVCDRWAHDFKAFFEDMGKKPSVDSSIERVDVRGGYTPENCIWADRITQANNKRETEYFVLENENLTAPQIAREYGIPYGKFRHYLSTRGFTAEESIFASRLPKGRRVTNRKSLHLMMTRPHRL